MRPVRYVATAADVSAGFTVPIPVDYLRVNGQYGLQYLTSAGGTGLGTMQQTLDDPFTLTSAQMNWTNIGLSNNVAQVNGAVRAFRINGAALGDVFTIVPQGGSPGV